MKFFIIALEEYSEEVREGIIKETNNQELIEYAVKSTDAKERAAVALNTTITDEQLRELANDPDVEVRTAVLRNKEKTTGNIIDIMLKDDETFGYENLIVNHPNVYKSTLERYIKHHKNEGLKIIAQKRLMYM